MNKKQRVIVAERFAARVAAEDNINLEDIISALDSEKAGGYFSKVNKSLADLHETDLYTFRYNLLTLDKLFFETAKRKVFSGRLVFGYLLFSDYVIQTVQDKLGRLIEQRENEIGSIESKVSELTAQIEQLSETVAVKIYNALEERRSQNKLFEWLADRVMSLNTKGRFFTSVSDYKLKQEQLSSYSLEKDLKKPILNCQKKIYKDIINQILYNGIVIGQKYRAFNQTSDQSTIYGRVIAEIRFDYAKELFNLKQSKYSRESVIDAAVKYCDELGNKEEGLGILDEARKHLLILDRYALDPDELPVMVVRFLSTDILYNYELHKKFDGWYINNLYKNLKLVNQRLSEVEKGVRISGNIDMITHGLIHSNEKFAIFLNLLEANHEEHEISVENGEQLREGFKRIYDQFLGHVKNLIRMKKIPEKFISQYKLNPYERV